MVLAPMADVTDAAFRRIIAKYGKPDVMFTEFVSADGLCSTGRKKLLVNLMYSESERPIVAQLFTGKPEKMREAAKLAKELGFDGVDINMGCPDKKVEKQCAGASLIKNPKLARELIRAAKEGAEGLPVSVKTRLGYNKDELETWLPELLAEEPAAIIIHARTRKEMSLVPARWERVKRAVEIRESFFSSPSAPTPPARGGVSSLRDGVVGEKGEKRALGASQDLERSVCGESERCTASVRRGLGGGRSKTLILGNGDALDVPDARKKIAETGADGVMLGRAIFGNPWLFSQHPMLTKEERLPVMVEHTKLFDELLGKHKNFAIMKKHYKAYVNGFDGAKELRMKLMEAENSAEVEALTLDFLV